MKLDGVNIPCRDKHALAAFWCEVLGTTVRGEVAQYLGLHPVAEGHPRLLFQQVEDLPERGRLHLDLESEDVAADVARVVALGATVVDEVTDFGVTWVVLADPEGNLFCVVPAS